MKRSLLLPLGLMIGTAANAAPDPAELFLSKIFAGDTLAATKLLIEPILQDTRMPLVPAKAQFTAVEFINAVKGCAVQRVQNHAPSSMVTKISPEFRVVWDCGAAGVKADVRASAEGKVLIMDLGKAIFAPPPPPVYMPPKSGNQ